MKQCDPVWHGIAILSNNCNSQLQGRIQIRGRVPHFIGMGEERAMDGECVPHFLKRLYLFTIESNVHCKNQALVTYCSEDDGAVIVITGWQVDG